MRNRRHAMGLRLLLAQSCHKQNLDSQFYCFMTIIGYINYSHVEFIAYEKWNETCIWNEKSRINALKTALQSWWLPHPCPGIESILQVETSSLGTGRESFKYESLQILKKCRAHRKLQTFFLIFNVRFYCTTDVGVQVLDVWFKFECFGLSTI